MVRSDLGNLIADRRDDHFEHHLPAGYRFPLREPRRDRPGSKRQNRHDRPCEHDGGIQAQAFPFIEYPLVGTDIHLLRLLPSRPHEARCRQSGRQEPKTREGQLGKRNSQRHRAGQRAQNQSQTYKRQNHMAPSRSACDKSLHRGPEKREISRPEAKPGEERGSEIQRRHTLAFRNFTCGRARATATGPSRQVMRQVTTAAA